jgi:hypothetical protein
MTALDGIPFLPAKYFTTGREAKITDIVLHWMATNLAGCDATFTSGNREASAHYGIEGEVIHQYVRDADTAWHCGDRAENHRSIGIEHSAQPGRDATPATIATSVSLITALCRKYGISPNHIYPHKKFFNTACPGTLPIADIVVRVTAQLGYPTNPAPTTPEVDMPLSIADADLVVKRLLGTAIGDGVVVATALQRAATSTPVDLTALAKAIVASLPVGGPAVTAEAIAKAVADEQARRLVS